MIFILLFIFVFVVTISLLSNSSNRFRQRKRQPDHIYNKIQQAMNWSPDHFHLRDDGKWRNAKGEEGICLSWKELQERIEKNELP